MACSRCRSAWSTLGGQDMASCPECCKQQRCKARKQGRLPPAGEKKCARCGGGFEAPGSAAGSAKYCQACRPAARRENLRQLADSKIPESSRRHKMLRGLRKFVDSAESAMAAQRIASKRCQFFIRDLPRRCLQCGEIYVSDPRRNSRHCSMKCCAMYRETLACVECGQPFVLRSIGRGAVSRRACPKCRRCVKKRSRPKKLDYRSRCRKFGVPYDPSVKPHLVFKNDGYRCHVCRRKTLKGFAWVDGKPHPRSPTVDHHPYPLSVGVCGHEWHNVRCCCFMCNVQKGAAWDGQRPLPMVFSPTAKRKDP